MELCSEEHLTAALAAAAQQPASPEGARLALTVDEARGSVACCITPQVGFKARLLATWLSDHACWRHVSSLTCEMTVQSWIATLIAG